MKAMLDKIEANPYGFDFFYLVRLLQAAESGPRVGESVRLREDFIRFRHGAQLRFTPSDIEGFRRAGGGLPAELDVNFLGLLGPNGPLPVHITDHVLARLRDGDSTMAAFLDMLQHRPLALFFRAWAVNQKTVDLDRPDGRRFAEFFASLMGFGMNSLKRRDSIPDLAKLYFSGHLASVRKNAEGLSSILGDFFGLPCAVESFHGHWIRIPEDAVCELGKSPQSGSLGQNVIVGSKVWQVQTKFRVRMGPMSLANLKRMLPGGESCCHLSWRRLKDWVATYIGHELAWDVQLVLRAKEVPQTVLGKGGGLLGWTTWINTRPPSHDAEDVILDTDLN